MIYISAQPDITYFTWQLELQLLNFSSLGIEKENIHILVAYNEELGLNPQFENLIAENNHLANFFIYKDQRLKNRYASSVRPHILKQHFSQLPYLENKTLFYHDSDILFSRIPEIEEVESNEICFVSDTKNYLNINYIESVSSEYLLNDMLKIVGLKKDVLFREDKNAGGAQYILKKITACFWAKVEHDSENLFELLEDYNNNLWEQEYFLTKDFRSKNKGIQAWCADMWAVLWNLWLINKKVEIHPEMAFSWPYDPIEDWTKFAIQHYSGNIKDKNKYFKKGEYINYKPWHDNALDNIPPNNCSFEIVQLIKQKRKELDLFRPSFTNSIILLEADIVDEDEFRKFEINKSCIQKHFDIDIILLTDIVHHSVFNNQSIFLKSEQEQLEKKLDTFNSYIIFPSNLILNKDQLTQILTNDQLNIKFVPDSIFKTDQLFTEAFSKILDVQLFCENKGKFKNINNIQSISVINKEKFNNYIKKQFNDFTYNHALDEAYLIT